MSTQKDVAISLKPGTTMVYLRNQGGQTFRINYPGGQMDVTTVLERAITSGKVQTYTVKRRNESVTISAPAGAQFTIVWDNGSLAVNGTGTPALGPTTATIAVNNETSQRVAFTAVQNATNYRVRRFTDAGKTQLADTKNVASGGNLYADFNGLSANTHYWYDVLPEAAGYTSPSPAPVDATTPVPNIPALGAITASIVNNTQTSQRLSFTTTANATNYHARRFTDAGRTQLADQKDVVAGGNAYVDFTGLTVSTHYWYDVVPQASGYTSPAPATADATTLAALREAFWTVYNEAFTPNEAQIMEMPNYGYSTNNDPVKADWKAFFNQPKYCTIALLNFVPTHWAEENNLINNGPINTGETFRIIATIPAAIGGPNSGPGGNWTIVQSDPTDWANLVVFS